MGKLGCKCGWTISDVACPSSDTGTIFSEPQVWDRDFRSGVGVWECPRCGSIAIDEKDKPCHVIWYHPENRKCNNVVSPEGAWNFEGEVVEYDGIIPIEGKK